MSPGFYFKGFEHTGDFESYANASLSRVMDFAPYGASVSAMIEKSGERYCGHIEVCSKWGPFFVSASAASPADVLDRLLRKMQGKLQTWHERRFSAPRLDGPLLAQ